MSDWSEAALVRAWQPRRYEPCEAWSGHGDGEGNAVACGLPTRHAYDTDRGRVWLCEMHKPRDRGDVG